MQALQAGKKAEKQQYAAPKLTVYGSVGRLTNEIPPKVFGPADGAIYQQQSVHWKS